MGVDSSRVWNNEGAYSWRSESFDELLLELDMRLFGNQCFVDITRVANLISQIDYYSDIARTDKVAQKVFTRTAGKITGVVATFYNKDTSTDSIITETITRVNGKITACDSVFSTTENQKI